jgi:hypothetical protein
MVIHASFFIYQECRLFLNKGPLHVWKFIACKASYLSGMPQNTLSTQHPVNAPHYHTIKALIMHAVTAPQSTSRQCCPPPGQHPFRCPDNTPSTPWSMPQQCPINAPDNTLSTPCPCAICSPSMPHQCPIHPLSMPRPCPIHAPSMPHRTPCTPGTEPLPRDRVTMSPFCGSAARVAAWPFGRGSCTPGQAPSLLETPTHALTSLASLFYKSHAWPRVWAAQSFPSQPGSLRLPLNLALGCVTFLVSFLCEQHFP